MKSDTKELIKLLVDVTAMGLLVAFILFAGITAFNEDAKAIARRNELREREVAALEAIARSKQTMPEVKP